MNIYIFTFILWTIAYMTTRINALVYVGIIGFFVIMISWIIDYIREHTYLD